MTDAPRTTVDDARGLAAARGLDVVVVLSWKIGEPAFNVTSYGTTPEAKEYAADTADRVGEVLAGDGPAEVFEDFRSTDAAANAARADRLRDLVAECDRVLAGDSFVIVAVDPLGLPRFRAAVEGARAALAGGGKGGAA